MLCPTCKLVMLKCERLGGIYWYCQRCGCTVDSTSDCSDGFIVPYWNKKEIEQ